MKNIAALKYMPFPILMLIVLASRGQARLVLNGAHIVIANNATLVVANSAPNAITRVDGAIISEGEENKLQWMIGETTGTYTVPWSKGSFYLPLTFTKSAGSGIGNFVFSTFPTPPQNSLNLPAGVSNLNRGGTDKSLYFIDRFWQLNAQGYSVKPSLTNLQFSYIDAEHMVPNMIVETALGAMRYNDDTNSWDGFSPTGVANINTNQVTVASLVHSDLYSWWSLMVESSALPVRFMSFTAARQGRNARLHWKTAEETDIRNYEVQRSLNGSDFVSIGSTNPKGGHEENSYEHVDPTPADGRNFYRIKENDINGAFHYSAIRSIEMEAKFGIDVYPNPVTGNRFTINAQGIPAGSYTIQLFGFDGKLAASFRRELYRNIIFIDLLEPLQKGVYTMKLTSKKETFSTILLINGN